MPGGWPRPPSRRPRRCNWFTAVRPLSDVSGLAAALGVQAMTLGAGTARAVAMASFAAGIATGLRSQVAWLTLPLLIVRGLGTGGWGLGGGSVSSSSRRVSSPQVPSPQVPSPKSPVPQSPVPQSPVPQPPVPGPGRRSVRRRRPGLVRAARHRQRRSGAYWQVLSNQGAEDLGNIQMLWTTHNARALVGRCTTRWSRPGRGGRWRRPSLRLRCWGSRGVPVTRGRRWSCCRWRSDRT